MGYSNPPVPWATFEGRLTGRPCAGQPGLERPGAEEAPVSHKAPAYEPPPSVARPSGPVVPYAELHAHSHFSFLDGASAPERLVEEAVRLGLDGLALTDHDGFYGAPVFAEAAAELGLATVYGAELSVRCQVRWPRWRIRRVTICWSWPAACRGIDGWRE